jgi:hypothetical protein
MNPVKSTWQLNKSGFASFFPFGIGFVFVITVSAAAICFYVCYEIDSLTQKFIPLKEILTTARGLYNFLPDWMTLITHTIPIFYGIYAIYLKEIIERDKWNPTLKEAIATVKTPALIGTGVVYASYMALYVAVHYSYHYRDMNDAGNSTYLFYQFCGQLNYYLPFLGAFAIYFYNSKEKPTFNSFIKPVILFLIVVICIYYFTYSIISKINQQFTSSLNEDYEEFFLRVTGIFILNLVMYAALALTYAGIMVYSTKRKPEVS